MFALLEESGFTRVRSAVVPGFRFRKDVDAELGGGLWRQGGDDDGPQAGNRLNDWAGKGAGCGATGSRADFAAASVAARAPRPRGHAALVTQPDQPTRPS